MSLEDLKPQGGSLELVANSKHESSGHEVGHDGRVIQVPVDRLLLLLGTDPQEDLAGANLVLVLGEPDLSETEPPRLSFQALR